MGLPACAEHALSEDEVDVTALADAEADPMSICEQATACATTFCVGRWVTAIMVTIQVDHC